MKTLALLALGGCALVLGCAVATDGAPSALPARVETASSVIEGERETKVKGSVICVVQLRGEVNGAFNDEGLMAALAEAERHEPAAIIIDVDTTWNLYRGNDGSLYTKNDYKAGMAEVDVATETARQLGLYAKRVGARPKPIRVVAWVGRAVGPAAIIPFACSEVYVRSTTVHGAIGAAQMWTSDMKPSQMGRNLRSARMRSIALRAGHPECLVEAMYRDSFVLSYSVFTSGIRFFEDDSGDTLLTDGGGELGRPQKKDTLAESLAFTGNDLLVLHGKQGVTLGVAKACVDTLDGLAAAMGLAGSPTVIEIPVKKLGTSGMPKSSPVPTTESQPVVCVLQVRGEANEQFDREGLEAALKEAEARSPDVIVVDVDTSWDLYRGNDMSVYSEADAVASMNEVYAATDAAWTLGRFAAAAKQRARPVRVVAWVGRAVGPSAILGLCCPETYYRSTTVHGGMASARQIVTPELDQKRRMSGGSLVVARMMGIAARAGVASELAEAMYREGYVLSYSVSSSGIRFFEDGSGDTLLTDSGDPDKGERDSLEESLTFTGNDSLVVRGEQGVKLGVAKACVDSLDELATAIGLVGSPVVIQIPVKKLGKSETLKSSSVENAERPVVCVLQLRGEVNEQFDEEGLKAALVEAETHAPKAIVIDIDTTWKLYRGNDRTVYSAAECQANYDEIDTAAEAARNLSLYVAEAGQRAKPMRVITWVGRAIGPSAVLGFCSPEMYYRSTAVHGGIECARQIVTPEEERRILYSNNLLRWKRIESIAVKSGYPLQVVDAMIDSVVFSYSVRSDALQFFDDASGDTRLTDGGDWSMGKGKKDTLAESLAFTGNDSLIVRGDQGVKLGLAKACADSVEELVTAMGFGGTPVVVTLPVKKLGPAEPAQK